MTDTFEDRLPQWPDLGDLQAQFPALRVQDIAAVLVDARNSVELFGLTADHAASMVTKIAVEQLRQLTGESPSGNRARLDPETHQRRSASAG